MLSSLGKDTTALSYRREISFPTVRGGLQATALPSGALAMGGKAGIARELA